MINKLRDTLIQDGLTFKKLADDCKTQLRMNFNPLSNIRKYLLRNSIDIPVHYIETGYIMHRDDILRKICGKAVPIIVAIAKKKEGFYEHFDIRIVTLDACKVDPDDVVWFI